MKFEILKRTLTIAPVPQWIFKNKSNKICTNLYVKLQNSKRKKSKELRKGKIVCDHGSQDSILLGCNSSQLDLQIHTIPIKIPASYFLYIEKLILKFTWKDKQSIASTIPKMKENKVGGFTLSKFRTYSKGTVINTAWH